jgi:hypothetical protein
VAASFRAAAVATRQSGDDVRPQQSAGPAYIERHSALIMDSIGSLSMRCLRLGAPISERAAVQPARRCPIHVATRVESGGV